MHVIFYFPSKCTRSHKLVYFPITRPRRSVHAVISRNWIIMKLLAILAAFILVWCFVMSNALRYLLSGDMIAQDVPSAFMAVLDSIILGNVFGINRLGLGFWEEDNKYTGTYIERHVRKPAKLSSGPPFFVWILFGDYQYVYLAINQGRIGTLGDKNLDHTFSVIQ